MSLSHRRIATALLSASLVVAPVGAFAADPVATPPTTSEPGATDPAPSDPAPSDPAPSDPAPSDPAPSDPAPSDPAPEEAPEPTPEPAPQTAPAETVALQSLVAADLAGPPGAAADWLVTQLVDGNHYEQVFGNDSFPDHGLTADGLLALVAAGGHETTVAAMTDWLELTAEDYNGVAFGDLYVAGSAKLALMASVTGRDPHSFGERDLIADLDSLLAEDGRYSDASAFGDFSNTITQSIALIALARAGEAVPAHAASFLIDQQCADGGFQAQFPDGGSCASDPDSTGFALQALAAAGGTGAAGDAGVQARDWLRENRQGDGSWAAEGTVNATALASGGLLVVGDDVASSVAWLEGAQLDDGALPVNPSDAAGDARATTQAVLSLAGESLLSVGPGGTDRVALVPTPATGDPGLVTPPVTSPAAPVVTAPADDGAAAATVVAADRAAPTGTLANTGGSPALPTAVAFTLVLLGAALVLLARQSPARHVARHSGGVDR